MTATGTTTAIATVPPVERPLLPVAGTAVVLDNTDEEDEEDELVGVVVGVGVVGTNVLVEVWVTVTTLPLVSVDELVFGGGVVGTVGVDDVVGVVEVVGTIGVVEVVGVDVVVGVVDVVGVVVGVVDVDVVVGVVEVVEDVVGVDVVVLVVVTVTARKGRLACLKKTKEGLNARETTETRDLHVNPVFCVAMAPK
jgi:hypothetical protein